MMGGCRLDQYVPDTEKWWAVANRVTLLRFSIKFWKCLDCRGTGSFSRRTLFDGCNFYFAFTGKTVYVHELGNVKFTNGPVEDIFNK